ncbi:hypothetical protein MNBD_GAMMA23-456 [hydrothermal vent metagenome]|uniref:HMA domain-containing protein n=1 Tax=hydrothermal vent metagenome TaxID=652676 RepID=A0A3B0ZTS0_9ZZZZ
MFRKIFLSCLIAAALISSSFFTHATESKTITLDVPGMTCKFCPITIRKALKKVAGVVDAKADYDNKTATITFDPDKTNVEALIKATANAGYPSTLKKK